MSEVSYSAFEIVLEEEIQFIPPPDLSSESPDDEIIFYNFYLTVPGTSEKMYERRYVLSSSLNDAIDDAVMYRITYHDQVSNEDHARKMYGLHIASRLRLR